MASTSSTINGRSHLQKGQNLMLAALGVVFGDIGTSPLYTLKECFGHSYGIAPTQENILGILSLVFWAILSVVSIKYVIFIMRADNKGEGGIMALMSLVSKRAKVSGSAQYGFMILGLIGASLFYGDGIITPAISVLSAVEGLEVLKPELHESIIPISLAVLVLLFVNQKHGTHKVGQLFGPIMVVWFMILAIFGIRSLLITPMVLNAVNPVYAYNFFPCITGMDSLRSQA
jgi:KUP system potassium uptake protein